MGVELIWQKWTNYDRVNGSSDLHLPDYVLRYWLLYLRFYNWFLFYNFVVIDMNSTIGYPEKFIFLGCL